METPENVNVPKNDWEIDLEKIHEDIECQMVYGRPCNKLKMKPKTKELNPEIEYKWKLHTGAPNIKEFTTKEGVKIKYVSTQE